MFLENLSVVSVSTNCKNCANKHDKFFVSNRCSIKNAIMTVVFTVFVQKCSLKHKLLKKC